MTWLIVLLQLRASCSTCSSIYTVYTVYAAYTRYVLCTFSEKLSNQFRAAVHHIRCVSVASRRPISRTAIRPISVPSQLSANVQLGDMSYTIGPLPE